MVGLKSLIPLTLGLLGTVALAPMASADGEGTSQEPIIEDNGSDASGSFCLTLLHNNDGESQLLNAGSGIEDFGGADRFATVVRQQRNDAKSNGCEALNDGGTLGRGSLLLSSGDNFLAGPEFTASLEKGVPFFDSTFIDLVFYDALAIGNHEFDFGPDVLADFIEGIKRRKITFLSANLDLSGEPRLQALADGGRIASSKVFNLKGRKVGVVGATTPDLPFISSPRNVVVNAVLPAVQGEIDRLTEEGVDIIVLISHLQSIEEDRELIEQLRDVDAAIAGGGDELLANPDDLLVPGDEDSVFGPYPLLVQRADGVEVPVITTPGSYKYLGRADLLFNEDGVLIDSEGGPVRVAGGDNPDAVSPIKPVTRLVVEPVQDFVDGLAVTVIGTSEVALEGRRNPGVRTEETNLGNLVADSLLAAGTELAPSFGAPAPTVAIQNGGGIRNDTLIPAGDITELDTFDILPFSNLVTIVADIPADQFKEIMENAVSQVDQVAGRFAQIAGFTMVYDPAGTAQELDPDDNSVITAGTRVQSLTLDDGTAIVTGGQVVGGAPSVNIAIVDFLARGGDQYPFRDATFTVLGISYQQALSDFIQDELGGVISAADYPEGGEGRITTP